MKELLLVPVFSKQTEMVSIDSKEYHNLIKYDIIYDVMVPS